MHAFTAAAIFAALGSSLPAHAQTMPADCSVGAIAEGPLTLRRPGLPDQPLLSAKMKHRGTTSVTSDDGSVQEIYQNIEFDITDRIGKLFEQGVEIESNFALAEGASLNGHIFRRPPAARDTPEYEAQAKVADQVEYQGWSVRIPIAGRDDAPYAVDVNHVFFLASAQVAFGQQDGNSLPGQIHLCVPGGQIDPFDNPANEAVEIFGSFVATVE